MLVPGKRLTVFAIRNTERRGTIWVRCGAAFVNKDESLNIYLDALPLDGTLHAREAAPERGQAAAPPDGGGAEPPAGNGTNGRGGHRQEVAAGDGQ